MATERIVTAQSRSEPEERLNRALRPERLDEYVGQSQLVHKLSIALRAATGRDEPVEHVLLHGPPGLGKTTLAHIIAAELGTHLTVTAGPALSKAGDLVGLLTKLAPRDVLFIDEVHRLPIALEEYLYSAMEDYRIDVQLDQGMHARTITLPVPPFTLIGATTRAGLLSGPMRSRFGIMHALDFYSQAELMSILRRSAGLLGLMGKDAETQRRRDEVEKALVVIAERSRGTPRIANRLLRRVRDFAEVERGGRVDVDVVEAALKLEGVDPLGLDDLDRRYMQVIGRTYGGGPVGLEAVAATMAEDAGTLEAMVEPYLLQVGFLARTRRGRQLTEAGARHVGVDPPRETPGGALFDGET
jgi:Holliday junction DNA helicase RuvB